MRFYHRWTCYRLPFGVLHRFHSNRFVGVTSGALWRQQKQVQDGVDSRRTGFIGGVTLSLQSIPTKFVFCTTERHCSGIVLARIGLARVSNGWGIRDEYK